MFLSFSSFDVQYSVNCTADILKIFDGSSNSSAPLYSQCGTLSSSSLWSGYASGNSVVIQFFSDFDGTAGGFALNWFCIGATNGMLYDSGGPSSGYSRYDSYIQVYSFISFCFFNNRKYVR